MPVAQTYLIASQKEPLQDMIFKLVLYIFFYEQPTSDGIFALTRKSEIKMLFEILVILTLS